MSSSNQLNTTVPNDLETGLVNEDGLYADPASVPADHCGHTHFVHRAPWLRALVLGANDGLVSVASLMMGVSAATDSVPTLLLTGISGLAAGALSMAVGEYISVASQRDTEQADIQKEAEEHFSKGHRARQQEFEELVDLFVQKGLTRDLAVQVSRQLSDKDELAAHLWMELGIDKDNLANPLQAALVSMLSFTLGASLPVVGAILACICGLQGHWVTLSILAAVTAGLLAFGAVGGYLGGANVMRGSTRVLLGGWLAMALVFGIGKAFGAAVPP